MRSIPAQIKSYAPGFALALVIALLAKGIEALLPFDVIGASVIAMFIGMLINGYRKPGKTTAPGVKFTAKKILKFAIILLGASLNVTTILNVGRMSLTVMFFTLLTCFGGGYFIGRALGLDWKLSNLISAGTGICGGSAIAAVAPVIDAKDSDIAYALSATFLFDMAMIVLFPSWAARWAFPIWPTASGQARRSTIPPASSPQAMPSARARATSPPWSNSRARSPSSRRWWYSRL